MRQVSEFDAGTTVSGLAVRGVILRHESGIEATVLTYGAHLVSVSLPVAGQPGERIVVTKGPTDVPTLETAEGGYMGATIGRVANRISGARFTLDGVEHVLEANLLGKHQIHGGADGFGTRVWTHELIETPESVGVRLALDSPDGDAGYPGSVHAEVTYSIDRDTLTIEHRATTDAPTPISMTNHAYWNLSGPAGDPTVGGHRLLVSTDRVLLNDDDDIPVAGPPVAVAGTMYDLDGSLLQAALDAGGIDNCFVVPDDRRDGEPVVVLEHPPTGRRLSVSTDQPGMQVYTGNHLKPPHSCIAFEPQAWPNSPNRPDFPPSILRPGEVYRNRSFYRFEW